MKKYEHELKELATAPPWAISDLATLRSAIEELIGTMQRLSSPDGTGTAGLAAFAAQNYFSRLKSQLISQESAISSLMSKIVDANSALRDAVDKPLPAATIDPAIQAAALIGATVMLPGLGTVGAGIALQILKDGLSSEREAAAKKILMRLQSDLRNTDVHIDFGLEPSGIPPLPSDTASAYTPVPGRGAGNGGARGGGSLGRGVGSGAGVVGGGPAFQPSDIHDDGSRVGNANSETPGSGQGAVDPYPNTNARDLDDRNVYTGLRPGIPSHIYDPGSTTADGSLGGGTLPGGTVLRGGDGFTSYRPETSTPATSGMSGGALSAAALAGSARLAGGMGSATHTGGGLTKLGSSGLSKIGGGLVGGSASGTNGATGESTASPTASKTNNSMMGGQPGGSATTNKEKRQGLGGMIAPKLDDDDPTRPQSASAMAGGRKTNTQKSKE